MIIEPSAIIREGISAIIESMKDSAQLSFADTVEEALKFGQTDLFKIVIVNPVTLNNSKKHLNNLLSLYNRTNVIGLNSNHYDRNLSDNFTDNIFITDKHETITQIISKHFNAAPPASNEIDNTLSEREIDVLKLLATGKSNKEIAEQLFISVHTVISHRKNISSKLGVKSTAALVIYAVANGLIDVDGFTE
ncbi:response regulator transcription factor [Draconibacterium sp. IB214405]|uniref:response regulator transcription factor n=1 Tax=Draconibacterium sp. IB214405 TaxID=3097352 RepID=UPI002A13CCCB|nr:response regulator transcription factor [Draconibacterium sp. IB214405]MDX8338967.1 response regulator transcription factor [Draconibacterium sp. IB214405]